MRLAHYTATWNLNRKVLDFIQFGDRNVYVLPASSTQGISPRHLPVLLPANLISELVSDFPDIYLDSATHRGQGLTLSRAYWTQETLDLENGIVDQYLSH